MSNTRIARWLRFGPKCARTPDAIRVTLGVAKHVPLVSIRFDSMLADNTINGRCIEPPKSSKSGLTKPGDLDRQNYRMLDASCHRACRTHRLQARLYNRKEPGFDRNPVRSRFRHHCRQQLPLMSKRGETIITNVRPCMNFNVFDWQSWSIHKVILLWQTRHYRFVRVSHIVRRVS